MKRLDERRADQAIERGHRRFVILFRRQRVARREDVAGIDADAESVGVAHLLQNRRQLLEAAAQTRPLSGGRLQQTLCADATGLPMHLV